MNKLYFLGLLFAALLLPSLLVAQTPAPRDKVGVLSIDAKGLLLDPQQMGQLTRVELEKTGRYEVLDKYDIDYVAEREGLKIDNCYGKICLLEVGRKLRADKMLTGSAELIADKIVLTYRLIDVATESVERSHVGQYLNLKNQLPTMIELSLQQLLGLPVDQALLTKLTKVDDYASAINVPEVAKLNLSGPRMGLTVFTGQTAQRIGDPTARGGFDGTPVMFQFGYQFETSYLNHGHLQALFEFIPIITGLDQGQFLPSLSILHGIRSNRRGWEFAFGPIAYLNKQSEGLYDENGQWTRLIDWQAAHPGASTPENVITTLDTRGEPRLSSSFVFAFGKSFKSGKMNIPFNAFFIPNRQGYRFGLSMGFNGRG